MTDEAKPIIQDIPREGDMVIWYGASPPDASWTMIDATSWRKLVTSSVETQYHAIVKAEAPRHGDEAEG